MVQNKQIRNFLFLLSGIVLLFCGSIPNFAESVIALLRGLLRKPRRLTSRMRAAAGYSKEKIVGMVYCGVTQSMR